jgi:hypothetical protein
LLQEKKQTHFPSRFRLTQIFHTDRDEEAAKADRARRAGASESTQRSILTQGCMSTYCPSQNKSQTQHPFDFPASAVDWYEISEVTRSSALLFKKISGLFPLSSK